MMGTNHMSNAVGLYRWDIMLVWMYWATDLPNLVYPFIVLLLEDVSNWEDGILIYFYCHIDSWQIKLSLNSTVKQLFIE